MKKNFLQKIGAVFLTFCLVSCVSNLIESKGKTKKIRDFKTANYSRKISKVKKPVKKPVKKNNNFITTQKTDNTHGGDLNDFIAAQNGDNSVLLFEYNPYHHECLPGYAKYFLELGYNVDVLMLDIGVDSFSIFDKTDKLRIYSYKNNKEIFANQSVLRSRLDKYKYVFLNTIDWGNKRAFNCLNILELPQSIIVSHTTETLKNSKYDDLVQRKRVVTLGEFDIGTYVNPHYFGQIPRVDKHKETRFVVVGGVEPRRRNYNQLMEAIEKLTDKSLNFKITAFGRNSQLDVPEKIAEHLEFKGCLSYKDMYEEIKNTDFILMLLDPTYEQHQKYKTTQVTGNAQLAYGFIKPVIINEEFADFYHFNSDNSIIEQDGDLSTAMEKAINCSQEEYSELQNNLKTTSDKIFEKSLENLRMMIQ